jgi:predicted O-methyltransferase YrrM
MTSGMEIEIKSPDGQTTLFLREQDGTIRVAHRQSDSALNFDASLELNKDSLAHSSLQILLSGLTKASPDPIATMRLNDLGYRSQTPMRHLSRETNVILSTLLSSAERTNYTYDITPRSRRHLAYTVALVTNSTAAHVMALFEEIENDVAFKQHVVDITKKQTERIIATSDDTVKLSRRLGWYAVARILKPRLVIETGVDKGLGSILLCAALRRNAEEESPGRYLGTDINPAAGYLLTNPYSEFGEIKYGDSIETLKTVESTVDLFINDSDHSAQYEADEYAVIAPRLSDKAIILGDNSHSTDKLADFADDTGRRFLFWQEKPVDHWYPGAGIGFAFK